jgi:GTP cyclohydrolase I/GTP cyclohydrolase-4
MRVGVTNIEKVIRIGGELYLATLDCFVDDAPRSGEVIDDVIGAVVLGEGGLKVEEFARRIAVEVRERAGAPRAEVHIAARYPEYRPAPASGIPTQEIYTLLGSAVASERGARRRVGVTAQGMLASPRPAPRLDGFTDAQVAAILAALPVATHDQRGFGTLTLELPEDCDADLDAMELLAIVEDSMSSEIYELMKRADEGAIVDKATRRARYPEDCVREALRGVVEQFGELPDDVVVSSRQESLETIHLHSVVAERSGLLGELRLALSAA